MLCNIAYIFSVLSGTGFRYLFLQFLSGIELVYLEQFQILRESVAHRSSKFKEVAPPFHKVTGFVMLTTHVPDFC